MGSITQTLAASLLTGEEGWVLGPSHPWRFWAYNEQRPWGTVRTWKAREAKCHIP